MSGFYQPQFTQGVYDTAANRLTVNCGDDVAIGFRAAPKELNAINIEADDSRAIIGRYAPSEPNAIELQIDTSRPLRFTIQVTEEDMWNCSRPVVRPLEIIVRNLDYESYAPVGQWRDATGCWAACLSWWLGVQEDRLPLTYDRLMMMFHKLWLPDGEIDISGLQQGLRAHENSFRMRTEVINPDSLSSYFGRWPLMIGFRVPKSGSGHMNVLYACNQTKRIVSAMEPWSPDPGDKIDYFSDGGMYLTDSNFQFRGAYVKSPLAYYQIPVTAGKLFIGYPKEYQNRLPS